MKRIRWEGVWARFIWAVTVLLTLGPGFLFGWRYVTGACGGFVLAAATLAFKEIRVQTGEDPFQVRRHD